ncbi:MAG: phosphate signaling complex protein PhoU [Planctomycetota bacterium]
MSTHLHSDLQRLQRQLLYLAAEVEENVRRAVAALTERKQDLALAVIEGDRAIDRREVELEEECLKVLALHHPVANDLRFVAACLKINNDLERIGDLAVNIAKRAAILTTSPPLPIPAQLGEVVEHATRMVREALDAFVRGDAKVARRICVDDDAVDRLHADLNRLIIREIEANPSEVEPYMLLQGISKSLERIADHATNIAEDVIYIVEGAIVRHGRGAPMNARNEQARS